MKSRKTYLEVVRIFACLTVIFVHTHFYSNNLSIKLFIGQCGVPLFFIITGYALFSKNHDYKDLLRKSVKKYIIPIFILVTFSVIFGEWILGNETFINCFMSINLSHLIKQYLTVVTLQFEDYKGLIGILWTFKFYLAIIIFYPILKSLMSPNKNKESDICRRILIIYIFICLIINTLINIFIIKLNTINLLFPDMLIYLLIGYEFKLHKEKLINGRRGIIYGLIITIIGLLSKYYVYSINPSLYYSYDQQLPTVIYSMGLFIFLSNIGLLFKQNAIINYISDKTYGIYLIHYLIIKKISTTNFYKMIEIKVPSFSFKEQFILELLYTIIVFVLCLIITIVIKKFIYYNKKIILHLTKNGEEK